MIENNIGSVTGVFMYNGYRINRVKMPDGKELFVRDDTHQPIIVLDQGDLQTIKVIVNGELKDPWIIT